MARQHGHPPVTFLGKGGSWIQNTLAPPCGSRWRCHGRVRLVLIFFLLIPFLFKQWWSGSGGPGRSQRVTTPHCSCGTTQTSRAWGAPPTDSVLEPELDTPQSQVKGWLAFTGVSFSWCFADIQIYATLTLINHSKDTHPVWCNVTCGFFSRGLELVLAENYRKPLSSAKICNRCARNSMMGWIVTIAVELIGTSGVLCWRLPILPSSPLVCLLDACPGRLLVFPLRQTGPPWQIQSDRARARRCSITLTLLMWNCHRGSTENHRYTQPSYCRDCRSYSFFAKQTGRLMQSACLLDTPGLKIWLTVETCRVTRVFVGTPDLWCIQIVKFRWFFLERQLLRKVIATRSMPMPHTTEASTRPTPWIPRPVTKSAGSSEKSGALGDFRWEIFENFPQVVPFLFFNLRFSDAGFAVFIDGVSIARHSF